MCYFHKTHFKCGNLETLSKETTDSETGRPSTTYTLFLCPHSHQLYNNNNSNNNNNNNNNNKNDDGGDVDES